MNEKELIISDEIDGQIHSPQHAQIVVTESLQGETEKKRVKMEMARKMIYVMREKITKCKIPV